eukprot:93471-Pyramimonas_sp.AAC.1
MQPAGRCAATGGSNRRGSDARSGRAGRVPTFNNNKPGRKRLVMTKPGNMPVSKRCDWTWPSRNDQAGYMPVFERCDWAWPSRNDQAGQYARKHHHWARLTFY